VIICFSISCLGFIILFFRAMFLVILNNIYQK